MKISQTGPTKSCFQSFWIVKWQNSFERVRFQNINKQEPNRLGCAPRAAAAAQSESECNVQAGQVLSIKSQHYFGLNRIGDLRQIDKIGILLVS